MSKLLTEAPLDPPAFTPPLPLPVLPTSELQLPELRALCLLDCDLLLSALLFPFSLWGWLLFILQGWCFLKYFLPYCLAPYCLRFPFSFPSCPLRQLISSPWPLAQSLAACSLSGGAPSHPLLPFHRSASTLTHPTPAHTSL